MQQVSEGLSAVLAEEVASLAVCCRIRRQDGEVIGLTEYDRPITLSGVTYRSSEGLVSTAMLRQGNLAVDGGEVLGVLADDAIREEDIRAGRYDGAEIRLFWVNAANPSQGRVVLAEGTLGEVEWKDGRFRAEIRGLSQPLAQQFVEGYSPGCRAEFGDNRCKLDVPALAVEDVVAAVTDRSRLRLTETQDSGSLYRYGRLRFASGANAGLVAEVKYMQGREVMLALPMPFAVEPGDAVELSPGCDKRFATCRDRFDNAVNFRGEPHVPGIQRLLETAATRG